MEEKIDREDFDMDDDRANNWWDSLGDNSGDRDNSRVDDEGNITITLPLDVSEQVTVNVLKKHLEYIYEKETNHKVFCEYYHDDDKEYDRKLKKSIKRVLKYFGEDVD